MRVVRQARVQPYHPYRGADLSHPRIAALRPLVADILGLYGNPGTHRARVLSIANWVSRTQMHQDYNLHPNPTLANTVILPIGKTWADVRVFDPLRPEIVTRDNTFWDINGWDGTVMLDKLLGTLDMVTGVRANDGLLTLVSPGQYRMRDIENHHWAACTYQTPITQALWAAAGYQSMLLRVGSHDPTQVFLPDEGWFYCDATYDSGYALPDGTAIGVMGLWSLTQQGRQADAVLQRVKPPNDPETWSANNYMGMRPQGMDIVCVAMDNRLLGMPAERGTSCVDMGALTPVAFARFPVRSPSILNPDLGVAVVPQPDGVSVQLVSNWPGHVGFERRVNSGEWAACEDTDVPPSGEIVEYRSVDGAGFSGMSTLINT